MGETDDESHADRFPLVLYRYDGGELMMPATHVTALLRHVAETFRLWRVRGQAPLDLETTARLDDALVRYAADLDTGIAAADARGGSDSGADRATAVELAQYLSEVAVGFLADGKPAGGRWARSDPVALVAGVLDGLIGGVPGDGEDDRVAGAAAVGVVGDSGAEPRELREVGEFLVAGVGQRPPEGGRHTRAVLVPAVGGSNGLWALTREGQCRSWRAPCHISGLTTASGGP
ncbi:hypothetical protein [Kitasatospora sp. NPDC058190]|uniref:hypothetical protein n=1 Tax=Kitasatospora sp. NPDC058190 TaxID=3346371 RepID=UPI0036DC3DAF